MNCRSAEFSDSPCGVNRLAKRKTFVGQASGGVINCAPFLGVSWKKKIH
ncbi:MAG: hypothetical protein HOH62_11695 [Verrucomicrobia bacterium]|nr:hypothetical protein [Verrucomicrobiota bacterium]MBT3841115.1 hypothetical protein [Verrucomicrobiota bacterium]MBT5619545.1 hypothetical protein [Verrucomicrobiota bacterium]MBT6104556.1 hypothetical protein [Verrucomicrobiota bacterium]MBT6660658.1 hypothetical protein [Verrucomicrobiota bacterium]